MPHLYRDKRDEIDALIGPIEGLIAKAEEAIPMRDGGLWNTQGSTLAGLHEAKNALEDLREEIDTFEEPEPETEEAEEDELGDEYLYSEGDDEE